jgi:hypothetical protein
MCGKSWKDQLLEDLIVINKFIHYAEQPNNKIWPEWECVRWTWTGDVYNRRVVCLEWRKRK